MQQHIGVFGIADRSSGKTRIMVRKVYPNPAQVGQAGTVMRQRTRRLTRSAPSALIGCNF